MQAAEGAPITPQSSFKEFHIVVRVDDVQEVSLDGRTCQISYRWGFVGGDAQNPNS